MIDIHAHALEAFNRETHSDALRELQIAPAEDLQAEQSIVGSHVGLVVPLAFFLGVLLTVVAVHA
ncbi:Putative membrane protein [Sphingopyxis fribergensis]|uniref:Putative membrane protein n=1 Tax=Sphingopyxis fribergensis TaxID=1515612 RepID=A0A0A7PBE2_9SPHN|nr:hypothetical protein [Sphingopyxis fribergensis]AJA07421.1 Putative membrane protein [Sphingopyxis fribergensis]